jgi:hypothetical protein
MFFLRSMLPAAAAIFLLGSCNQHFYRPRPLDQPMVTEAGQVKASFLLTSTSAYISGAWSPVKNIGVQAGINGLGEGSDATTTNTNTEASSEKRSHYFVSAGYYQQNNRPFHFEVYGGVGRAQYRHSSDQPVRRLVFGNYFLQPAVVATQKGLQAALSLRYDYLHRSRTETDPSAVLDYNGVHKFLQYSGYHFLQPGLTLNVGGGGVQGHFEFSSSFVLDKGYATVYGGDFIQNGTLRIALGLTFRFDKLFADKKSR